LFFWSFFLKGDSVAIPKFKLIDSLTFVDYALNIGYRDLDGHRSFLSRKTRIRVKDGVGFILYDNGKFCCIFHKVSGGFKASYKDHDKDMLKYPVNELVVSNSRGMSKNRKKDGVLKTFKSCGVSRERYLT